MGPEYSFQSSSESFTGKGRGTALFVPLGFQAAPSSTCQEEGKVRSLAQGAQNLKETHVLLHRLAPAPAARLSCPPATRGQRNPKRLPTGTQPTPQQHFRLPWANSLSQITREVTYTIHNPADVNRVNTRGKNIHTLHFFPSIPAGNKAQSKNKGKRAGAPCSFTLPRVESSKSTQLKAPQVPKHPEINLLRLSLERGGETFGRAYEAGVVFQVFSFGSSHKVTLAAKPEHQHQSAARRRHKKQDQVLVCRCCAGQMPRTLPGRKHSSCRQGPAG